MTEPERNDGGIYASLEQLHGAGVAQDVRRESLAMQGRAGVLSHSSVLGQEPLDGVSAEGAAATGRK